MERASEKMGRMKPMSNNKQFERDFIEWMVGIAIGVLAGPFVFLLGFDGLTSAIIFAAVVAIVAGKLLIRWRNSNADRA